MEADGGFDGEAIALHKPNPAEGHFKNLGGSLDGLFKDGEGLGIKEATVCQDKQPLLFTTGSVAIVDGAEEAIVKHDILRNLQ